MSERQAPPPTPEELLTIGSWFEFPRDPKPAKLHAYGERCFKAGKAAALEGPVWAPVRPHEDASECRLLIVAGEVVAAIACDGEVWFVDWIHSDTEPDFSSKRFDTEAEARAAVEKAVRNA